MDLKEQIEYSTDKWNDPKFTEVMVYSRPNMRNDEMTFYIGFSVYTNIFDKRIISQDSGNVSLVYPERFLNIVEQRMLCSLFWYYNPNVTKVQVLTHSVYIIQCTRKECIKMAHFKYQDEMDMTENDNYLEDFVNGKRRFSAPIDDKSVSFDAGIIQLK